MNKERKKRSPNYTFEEKENLLSLVAKYKNVLECKKTGSFYLQKKKEAWQAVTKQYNSLCTTGFRDEEMLKHFYNNCKHRARKLSANENKQRYLRELLLDCKSEINETALHEEIPCENLYFPNTEDNVTVTEESIKELKKKWADEKKNLKKTGGGSYAPILNDADHQVLSILDDQITPDKNPFDEAAEYFGDTEVPVQDNPPQTPQLPGDTEDPVQDNPPQIPQVEPLKKIYKRVLPPSKAKRKPKVVCLNKSAETLKKIYFKKKIELVYYAKKTEMLKFRSEKIKLESEQKKHEIEMKILKKQLEKLEKI